MQAPRPTGGEAHYVYAILAAERCSQVRADGLPDDLDLVERGPFAAVVRRVTEEPLAGHDREQLARLLIAYQQVVERVMAHGAVLPVKFGTVAPDRESVERCLETGCADFAAALDCVQGKAQFEIVVTWDLETIFAEIAADREVARLKTELAAATDDPDPETSARLGKVVKRVLERRRSELGEHLSGVLRGAAIDSVANPLMDERMVLNLALLVDAERTDALNLCLEELDAVHDGKLTFRCVGPLPPHSFASVEIAFLDPGRIARARQMLGLDTVQDAEAVRAAFRRRAKQVHPDLAADHADGEGIMDLHDAYKTLSAYVQAGGPVIVSVSRQEAALAAGLD